MATTPSKSSPSPAPTPKPNAEPALVDGEGFSCGPLTVEERPVIYEYLNTWIQHYALDAFCTKQWTKDEFVFQTDTINKVNIANDADAAPRSMTNVKRQIRRLYQGRKSPLGKLSKRSEHMKLLLELGKLVEDSERFPDMAIRVATVVDGVCVIGTSEEKAGAKADHGAEVPETPEAKNRRKEKIVRLAVNWTWLHVREDGQMAVLSDGEVWESPVEEDGIWEDEIQEGEMT